MPSMRSVLKIAGIFLHSTVLHVCHQILTTFYTSDCKKSFKHLLTHVSKISYNFFRFRLQKSCKHLLARVTNFLATFFALPIVKEL